MKISNTIKTVFFLTLLTLLLVFIGQMVGGKTGALIALILAGAMNFFSYWYSDKIVLRMYRAQPIDFHDHPQLYNVVNRLALRAGLPVPKIYVIPESAPNAFATGRNPEHAAVAVTQGLMQSLTERELEGVIGHELAHVKNRDILIGSVVATIAGAIAYLAQMAQWAAFFGGFGGRNDEDDGHHGGLVSFILMVILAPLIATLIQLAVSRSREFLADRVGAEISGRPNELANALVKLDQRHPRSALESNNASAHLFIVSPLNGKGVVNLFRTHPSTEERVERLRSYSANMIVSL